MVIREGLEPSTQWLKVLDTRLVQFCCVCLSPIITRFLFFSASLSSPGANDLRTIGAQDSSHLLGPRDPRQ